MLAARCLKCGTGDNIHITPVPMGQRPDSDGRASDLAQTQWNWLDGLLQALEDDNGGLSVGRYTAEYLYKTGLEHGVDCAWIGGADHCLK